MQSAHIVTVTTAAASYDLVDIAAVKDELSIKDNSSNATLKRYITSVSAMVAQYCNRVFPAETLTEQFWAQRDSWPRIIPGGIPSLQLSRWPIQSVTSVTENGATLMQDSDFRIDAANGQLIRLDTNGYPKLWPVYPIVVVYIGGFAEIPPDVADKVISMVTQRYAAKGRDKSLMQENIPGVMDRRWWIASGSDTGNMTPDVTDVLDNYRIPVLTGA